MKLKPATERIIYAVVLILSIITLILVFLSRSFFLNQDTIYGHF